MGVCPSVNFYLCENVSFSFTRKNKRKITPNDIKNINLEKIDSRKIKNIYKKLSEFNQILVKNKNDHGDS